MESLATDRTVREQFAAETTYLNTASLGVLPRDAADAVRTAIAEYGVGRPYVREGFEAVQEARELFARLVGVDASRVAAGASVAVYAGLLASALPTGAEVLVPDDDFSSLVNPFAVRGDLKLRSVPLSELADAVRPGTALVAVSAVQSADGRIADLAARTFVDASQAVGWLPLRADDFDFLATVGYKWLLAPRGAAFLVTPRRPVRRHAGLRRLGSPARCRTTPATGLSPSSRGPRGASTRAPACWRTARPGTRSRSSSGSARSA